MSADDERPSGPSVAAGEVDAHLVRTLRRLENEYGWAGVHDVFQQLGWMHANEVDAIYPPGRAEGETT